MEITYLSGAAERALYPETSHSFQDCNLSLGRRVINQLIDLFYN